MYVSIYYIYTLRPQNHEIWRFWTRNIWVITPKNEGCGFQCYIYIPLFLKGWFKVVLPLRAFTKAFVQASDAGDLNRQVPPVPYVRVPQLLGIPWYCILFLREEVAHEDPQHVFNMFFFTIDFEFQSIQDAQISWALSHLQFVSNLGWIRDKINSLHTLHKIDATIPTLGDHTFCFCPLALCQEPVIDVAGTPANVTLSEFGWNGATRSKNTMAQRNWKLKVVYQKGHFWWVTRVGRCEWYLKK